MPECDTTITISLSGGKLHLGVGDVHVFRRNGDLSPLVEVGARGEVADFHSADERVAGLGVEACLLRLLSNIEFDLASCSCSPGDPCPAHALARALKFSGKVARRRKRKRGAA